MEVKVFDDYHSLSRYAANLFLQQVRQKPESVLGLATGGTPEGFYRQLVQMSNEESISYKAIRTFNLDEYYPINHNHPQSYWTFMKNHLFSHVSINENNIFIPNGETSDVERECERYEQLLKEKGGIDLQILGIGENGHIGFNEPGASFASRTRVVELTPNTIQANSRFFTSAQDVPRHAITMGIASILESKKIIVLASGKKKAKVVSEAINGKVTEEVPASVLQHHPNVLFLVDQEAAVNL
ncbi:glucosamine-6-phosphate deaminase [Brevibacillus daliensis]|uniref:glucosamine-6-phosphate deaminase n=1 Tax=Brevibacillus daliensis TaxID=2892995 RepID=UPI001E313D18|nr:glucosamine-6-phosphate deaminase [Brevibacillus daliensis]